MTNVPADESDVILVLNAGSSSLKFSVYGPTDAAARPRLRGHCDYASRPLRLQYQDLSRVPHEKQEVAGPEVEPQSRQRRALDSIWRLIAQQGLNLAAVGHRVVHGGPRFTQPTVIDAAVLDALEALIPWAPLHQADCLSAIKLLREQSPNLLQVACFDTSFHATLPQEATTFALPRQLTANGLRRYGFHGLSFQSIIAQLQELDAALAMGRVIVAHLGSGSSLCGLRDGKSCATTMGLTPLDGLPMATRCGSLDPGIVLHLLHDKQYDPATLQELLYRQSGLLGVSQLSGDLRTLMASDRSEAAEAVDLLVYRIVCEIGSLAAALQGVDTLVFTGGIGENSAEIRHRVCSSLGWLGVTLDSQANTQNATQLNAPESKITILKIHSDEAAIIAQAVKDEILGQSAFQQIEKVR